MAPMRLPTGTDWTARALVKTWGYVFLFCGIPAFTEMNIDSTSFKFFWVASRLNDDLLLDRDLAYRHIAFDRFDGRLTEAFDLIKLSDGFEWTVLCAIVDDGFGLHRPDAFDRLKLRLACRIQVNRGGNAGIKAKQARY